MKKILIITLAIISIIITIALFYKLINKNDNAEIVCNMVEHPAYIYTDSMIRYSKTTDKYNAYSKLSYNYVFYFDSTDCSQCMMNQLFLIDSINKKISKNFDFTLIFDVNTKDTAFFRQNFLLSSLNHDIYADTSHTFRKNNSFVTANHLAHYFLVDSNNIILLVGDPIHNSNIEKMLYKIVNSNYHNH